MYAEHISDDEDQFFERPNTQNFKTIIDIVSMVIE